MATKKDLSWSDVLRWRMSRQFLGATLAGSVEEVVKRLTTVPTWSGDAELSVALRLAAPDSGAESVAAAFAQGKLVKTFAFRGATHYFVPEDAGVYLALRSIGRQWELKSWRDFYQLDATDWPTLRQIVREAVADGPLTQSELAGVVSAVPRFRHLEGAVTHKSLTFLKPFAWQGDFSLAPARDGQVVVQSLADVPGWGGIPSADDAGPRAILAYLAAYGPATAVNLNYWFGEGLSAGRKNIDRWIHSLVGTEVAELHVGGMAAFCRVDQLEELSTPAPSTALRLLPGLDQWIFGPGTADGNVVPAPHRSEVSRGANLLVVGGSVEGTWKISNDVLTATRFDGVELPAAAIDSEVDRVAAILGRPLSAQTG